MICKSLDDYRFNDAASELYAFVWHELCSWYLEFSKGTLYNDADPAYQQGARHTLLQVYNAVIRLMHPIMPFLSEELWSNLPGTKGYVMNAAYPKSSDFPNDKRFLTEIEKIQAVIVEVRRVRAEMQIPNRTPMVLLTDDITLLEKHAQGLKDLCGVEESRIGSKTGVCAPSLSKGKNVHSLRWCH